MKKFRKKVAIFLILSFVILCTATMAIYNYTDKIGKDLTISSEETEEADCIIVLGAGVYGDSPSLTLKKRLDKALEIYQMEHTKKIMVSGDHGQKNYNEVGVMRDYLMKNGVPKETIFMDHAGFSTYETMYRARDVFQVKSAIIVTQRLHLRRALLIADSLGIDVLGVEAENSTSASTKIQQVREYPARVKAFIECKILHPKPKYLGEIIPIFGNGIATEG